MSERECPVWKGDGEKLPGCGVGVCVLMTEDAPGVGGPPLMTEGEGDGEGQGVLGFWEGTMPGNTGVMGAEGSGCWGPGVVGVEPWGITRGPLSTPGVVFRWLPGLG